MHHEEEEATCTKDGSKEYYYCVVCEKYFEDARATKEVPYLSVVIKASHNYVITIVDPTFEYQGYTLHYCAACNDEYKSDYTEKIKKIYLIVTCDKEEGGMVSEHDPFYKEGAKVTLTATPKGEYKFVGWYNGTEVVSTSTTYTFNMPSEDYTLVAKFEEDLSAPSVWDGTVATGFQSGNGTYPNPYIIANASQLAYLAEVVNSGVSPHNKNAIYYKLVRDIDIDYKEWTPIGQSSNYFCGVFLGNNRTISNLRIKNSNTYCGLFGITGKGAGIQNVSLYNAEIIVYNDTTNNISAGALIGYANETNVLDCYSTGMVRVYSEDAMSVVGGLIGSAKMSSLIKNCYSTVSAGGTSVYNKTSNVGGLVGSISDVTIQNSFATGNVFTNPNSKNYVGGLIGAKSGSKTTITNSYRLEGQVIVTYESGNSTKVSGTSYGETVTFDQLN